MKVAVLGPICKDYIKVDDDSQLQIGGIPYYVTHVFKNLGVESIVPFITFNKEDKDWVRDNFKGIKIEHISVEKTLEFRREYSSDNPDICSSIKIEYSPNIIKVTDSLINKLEKFDYIILSPLFYDNIPQELFFRLKHKNLVHGNFGMFTYAEKNNLIQKNPENLIKILPYLNYLFLDVNESRFISNKENISEMGRFFQDKGLENMIITDGSKGSHLFVQDKYYQIPAYPPKKIIDPTGAGDTYLAAFIRSLDLFDNPEEQGKFAAMTATISLEKRGAFDGNIEDVKERLGI